MILGRSVGKYQSFCCIKASRGIKGCTNRGYTSARFIDAAVLRAVMATLFTDDFLADLTADVNKRLAWIARQPEPQMVARFSINAVPVARPADRDPTVTMREFLHGDRWTKPGTGWQGGSGEGRSHRPCHRNSVRAHTLPVHAPVRPWSPHSPRLRRGRKSAHTAARQVPAATSDAGRRGRRSTRSSQSTSKAGLRIGRSSSSPSRRTSNGSYGHTSPVASSALDSAGHAVLHAGRVLSWPSRARAAASVPPATAAGWHRQLRISSTASYPRCLSGNGWFRCQSGSEDSLLTGPRQWRP